MDALLLLKIALTKRFSFSYTVVDLVWPTMRTFGGESFASGGRSLTLNPWTVGVAAVWSSMVPLYE